MLNILLRIREAQNNKMQFFTLQSTKDKKKVLARESKQASLHISVTFYEKRKSVQILTDVCFNTAMYFRDTS